MFFPLTLLLSYLLLLLVTKLRVVSNVVVVVEVLPESAGSFHTMLSIFFPQPESNFLFWDNGVNCFPKCRLSLRDPTRLCNIQGRDVLLRVRFNHFGLFLSHV